MEVLTKNIIADKSEFQDLNAFLKNRKYEILSFENDLVIDISDYDKITLRLDVDLIKSILNHFKNIDKVLVFVSQVEFSELEDMIITPTLVEANDYICMENLQKEMGF